MNPRQVTVPLVHSNGTPQAQLVDQYQEAFSAANGAMSALQASAPNQRDYYLMPPGAWDSARKQHNERVESLQRLCDDLYRILETVVDGGGSVDHWTREVQ